MTRPHRDIAHVSFLPLRHDDWRTRDVIAVSDVEVGQCYRKHDALATTWEVVACVADASGVRHARLRNVADPTVVKLISDSALRNPRLYCCVATRPA